MVKNVLPQKPLLALVKNTAHLQAVFCADENVVLSEHAVNLKKNYRETFYKLVDNARNAATKAASANTKKLPIKNAIINFSNADMIVNSVKPIGTDMPVPKLVSSIKKGMKSSNGDVVVIAQHLKLLMEQSPSEYEKLKASIYNDIETIETICRTCAYTNKFLEALTVTRTPKSSSGGGGVGSSQEEQSKYLILKNAQIVDLDVTPITKYVFFSDEEGQGQFTEHLKGDKFVSNKDTAINNIDKGVQFVFLGDSVDRGDRGKAEIDLLKTLLDLHATNQMLLLAGNRDVNKLRMRYELAIDIVHNTFVIDAYDYLYCILSDTNYNENALTALVTFIANKMAKEKDAATPQEITYAWVALAYQWLTRRDILNSSKCTDHPIDEAIGAEWKFNQTAMDKMWGITSGANVAKYDAVVAKSGGDVAKYADTYITAKFGKRYVTKDDGSLDLLPNGNKKNDVGWWYHLSSEVLSETNILRVNSILGKTYGIVLTPNMSPEGVTAFESNWLDWAKAALQPENKGLYIAYIEKCSPFHTFKLGNANIFCAHALPDPLGIQTNWDSADHLLTSALPIQRANIGPLYNAAVNKYNSCAEGKSCKCGTENLKFLQKFAKIISDGTKSAPYDTAPYDLELFRILAMATGYAPSTLLMRPTTAAAGGSHKKKISGGTNSAEYCEIDAYFNDDFVTEGNSVYKNRYVVHGHQPFGIPYSTDIYMNGTNDNVSGSFKRICVDVSNDDTHAGQPTEFDKNYENYKKTKKNWAYVTFAKKEDGTNDVSITATGTCRDTAYFIPNLINVVLDDPTNKLNGNITTKLFNPYIGVKNDDTNKVNKSILPVDKANNIDKEKYYLS